MVVGAFPTLAGQTRVVTPAKSSGPVPAWLLIALAFGCGAESRATELQTQPPALTARVDEAEPGCWESMAGAANLPPTASEHDASPPAATPALDDPCRETSDCNWRGRCASVEGECRALSDAECRASHQCAELGYCSAADGVCRALTDADCVGSERCILQGRCSATSAGCQPGRDTDCRGSLACATSGSCGLVSCGRCGASSEADCRASAACKTDGMCTFVAGVTCARARTHNARLQRVACVKVVAPPMAKSAS